MKVFQIGAAGGVGRRLCALLTARGDQVSGLHRGPEQAGIITAAGGVPILADLITIEVDELAKLIAGHDAIVFSAGAHGTGQDKTTLIDGKGLEKAASAAALAGVSRFVLVSVFPDALRGQETTQGFEHYMRVKKSADVHLSGTGLDWVIVRPGTLRDEAGSGLVNAGLAVEYAAVARDNVAAFICCALHEPKLSRMIIELTDGDIPIAEAVGQFAAASGQHR